MPPKVGVVVDSTADFPPGLADELGIVTIPIHLHADGEDYLDGMTITPAEIWAKLRRNLEVETRPASPPIFATAFGSLLVQFDRLVYLHVSAQLSGCSESATEALRLLQPSEAARIRLVDTGHLSISQGLLAWRAAEWLRAGNDPDCLDAYLQPLLKETMLCFTVESLSWLRRSDRLAAVTAFMGNLLDIKPVVSLSDGRIVPLEKHRGRRSAIDALIRLAARAGDRFRAGFDLWTAHADVAEEGALLRDQIQARIGRDKGELPLVDIGAAVAVHSGPGTLAWAICPR
jgi:DegV family protein with EDD domain